MMKRTLLPTIVLIVVCVLPLLAAAQDSGGQFWVQAFEDRNGDGVHDPGEPFLTSGVSVDLLNADGVVMASGTLDDAPFASRGFIGFLYLSPGSYTAVISSPDLTPTTAERVDVTITQGKPRSRCCTARSAVLRSRRRRHRRVGRWRCPTAIWHGWRLPGSRRWSWSAACRSSACWSTW